MSDLDPQQRAAHWESVRRRLDAVDELNSDLAERQAERQASGANLEERQAERLRERERQNMERAAAIAAQQRPAPRPAASPAPPSPGKVIHTRRDGAGDLHAAVYEGAAASAATSWENWINQRIDQKIKALVDGELLPMADEVGVFCGKLDRRIQQLEDRAAKSEEATVELLRELERELKELRERAILRPDRQPILISGGRGSDGAA